MITTGTPGYVTLKNILIDLSARSDDEITSYLNTLTSEDTYTLEQIALKEGMEQMAGIIHGHRLNIK